MNSHGISNPHVVPFNRAPLLLGTALLGFGSRAASQHLSCHECADQGRVVQNIAQAKARAPSAGELTLHATQLQAYNTSFHDELHRLAWLVSQYMSAMI